MVMLFISNTTTIHHGNVKKRDMDDDADDNIHSDIKVIEIKVIITIKIILMVTISVIMIIMMEVNYGDISNKKGKRQRQ